MAKDYFHNIKIEIINDGVLTDTIESMDRVAIRSNGSMEWSAYEPDHKQMRGTGRSVVMNGKDVTVRIEIHSKGGTRQNDK